ncbi:ergosterol biosynthesis ERG4/ERG24 family-domain-containing protein [Aspergillus californicus]
MTIDYGYGGSLGAAAITFGLSLLLYSFAFNFNYVAGCPILSLSARPLSWENVKADTGLSDLSTSDSISGDVITVAINILPAKQFNGTKLVHHGIVVTLVVCAVGTYLQGAHFALLTANILALYALSAYLYIYTFSVDTKYPNHDLRELAAGGATGNFIYDFYIGRELNPRVTLPLFGEVDIKTWCEMSSGLSGWILLDLAFIAQQYRNYGYVSDSIVFMTAVQAYYVFNSQCNESSILTMIGITTDGVGFMHSFGDLKHTFRMHPKNPAVANLSYIQTKRGTRLLTAGWWGVSRHINCFGDWLQTLPFSLRRDSPGPATGWAIVFTYFYVLYFGILLIHRERREDTMCEKKCGDDWKEYRRLIRWRIVPWVY